MNAIEVEVVLPPDERLSEAFEIRRKVFVIEQEVAEEEEYDEFEDSSRHVLATIDKIPVGTARWRQTEKGVKLERFAVLKEYRGRKIGESLVKATLDDVRRQLPNAELLYLHAQLPAIPLYEKFGFQKVGDLFWECDIAHYKMTLQSHS